MGVLGPASSVIPTQVSGKNQAPTLELALEDVANHPATNHTDTTLVLISHDSLKPWDAGQHHLSTCPEYGSLLKHRSDRVIPFLRKLEWHTSACGTDILLGRAGKVLHK